MLDWISDWLAGVALAVTTGAGVWLVRLAAKVSQHETRLALVEQSQTQIPVLLSDIKDELKGLREDGRTRQRELYEHIDGVRREIKSDLEGKQDKR